MRALREAHDARERRTDARFALVCAVLANCHRDKKRKSSPYQVEDFLPGGNRPTTQAEFDAKLAGFVDWAKSLQSNT